MGIKEIQEAKMILENEIEMVLNEFDKRFGTKICDLGHTFSSAKAAGGVNLDQVFHCIKLKIEI